MGKLNMENMSCHLQNRIRNNPMVKRTFSPYYYALRVYLNKLQEDQSGGTLPILYPEVNSKLEKIAESEKKI